MANLLWLTFVLVSYVTIVHGAIYLTVPTSIPPNASIQLVAAPVGISFEFFTFPAYMQDVASTKQCLQNLKDLTGTWPPIRIGGTTQDRATYSPAQSAPVQYSVANAGDAPAALTWGKTFLAIAALYKGRVILGLNRRLNNQSNTIQAASDALALMSNLNTIELGNEPNFYSVSDPIAGGSWNAAKDVASQVSWQCAVGSALNNPNRIFSAGVYFGVSSYSIQNLASSEGNSSCTVGDYCSHNYPQSASTANLAALMSHSGIKTQIAPFKPEYQKATSQGRSYIFGETNSATQGGGGISPTFGAGLWILDYVMQSLLLGVQTLYFHQGTIGNCQYCWWGRYDMGAPYYGAYFATLTLAGSSQIAPLDSGTTNYAGYAIFSGNTVTKVLLYNSDYYTGSGTRSTQIYVVSGLSGNSVTAIRLTAAAATSRQDQGQDPTIGGQTFTNGNCVISGAPVRETAGVMDGVATFTLAASEALLVYTS